MRKQNKVKLFGVLAVALVFLVAGCATLYKDRDAARSTIERARQAIASAETAGAPAGSIENAKAHLEAAVKELNFCRPIPARAAAERALAALGMAPPPPAPAAELVEKLVFENDVFFDFDKDELKPESITVLQGILERLQDNSKLVVRLAGHTDWAGPEVYNMDLSRRRALAVARWLRDHGITTNRISSAWYGETVPRTSNQTRDGRAQNRRTEIDLVLLP
jgi:outer membrane protein OmpA-like peptidoglycan-associated protein